MERGRRRLRLRLWWHRSLWCLVPLWCLYATACARPRLPPTEPHFPPIPQTAISDAPVLARAHYYALVERARESETGRPLGPFVYDKPGFRCGALISWRYRIAEELQDFERELEALREERALLAEEQTTVGKPETAEWLGIEVEELSQRIDETEALRKLRRNPNGYHCPSALLGLLEAHKDQRGVLLVGEDGVVVFHPDMQFLLPVDAPWKAALVGWFRGRGLHANVRSAEGGYEFIQDLIERKYLDEDEYPNEQGDCDAYYVHEAYELLVRVDSQGNTTEIERRRVEVSLEEHVDACRGP